LVELTTIDVSPDTDVRVHSGAENALLSSTCHSVVACVCPTSESENADAEKVGVTDTSTALSAGVALTGVVGAILVVNDVLVEYPLHVPVLSWYLTRQ
jgi:hypothetical protein